MTFASFLAEPWIAVVALLVTIVGAGRLTRLVTYDDYPPTVAIRSWWNRVTKGNGWAKLAYCLWCFTTTMTNWLLRNLGWGQVGVQGNNFIQPDCWVCTALVQPILKQLVVTAHTTPPTKRASGCEQLPQAVPHGHGAPPSSHTL